LLKAAGIVIKDFLKATSTHRNGFPKAPGKFMKKSAKNVTHSSFFETCLYEKKGLLVIILRLQ
jgi:hypothetical protein